MPPLGPDQAQPRGECLPHLHPLQVHGHVPALQVASSAFLLRGQRLSLTVIFPGFSSEQTKGLREVMVTFLCPLVPRENMILGVLRRVSPEEISTGNRLPFPAWVGPAQSVEGLSRRERLSEGGFAPSVLLCPSSSWDSSPLPPAPWGSGWDSPWSPACPLQILRHLCFQSGPFVGEP